MIGFAPLPGSCVDELPLDTDFVPAVSFIAEDPLAENPAVVNGESCNIEFVDLPEEPASNASDRAKLVENEPTEWIVDDPEPMSGIDDEPHSIHRVAIGYQGQWPLTEREADVLNALIGVHRGNMRRSVLASFAAVGGGVIATLSLAAAIFWGSGDDAGERLLPKFAELGKMLDGSADGLEG
jgi:hypothetical protein